MTEHIYYSQPNDEILLLDEFGRLWKTPVAGAKGMHHCCIYARYLPHFKTFLAENNIVYIGEL